MRGAIFSPSEARQRLPLARSVAKEAADLDSEAPERAGVLDELARLGFRLRGRSPAAFVECYAELEGEVRILSAPLEGDDGWTERGLAEDVAAARPCALPADGAPVADSKGVDAPELRAPRSRPGSR